MRTGMASRKQQRDAEFADFFAATWSRLYRSTYIVAGDHARTEDALQTAFSQAYAEWRRVVRADSPEAYVRRMAINAALSAHRKASSRREQPMASIEGERESPAVGDPTNVDELWDAVKRLPPRQRAVIVLRYREDLSERQIADILGCRPGTVKSTASAALATLRSQSNLDSLKQGEPS